MEPSNALTILKNAFFMESQGKILYETARDNAQNKAVKDFFQALADDEVEHIAILERQIKSYMDTGRFTASEQGEGHKDKGPDILNDEIKNSINTAGFEATAITAAIGFEKKAVELYAKRSKASDDPEEKKLYQWLSEWEKTHLEKLVSLQQALMDRVWGDNSFWPM
ncbi:MAG: rubrerythrin [Desulfobacterales bacterium]|nr:MAG: rubrerythrin [Desulfobacterales bacterium]